MFERIDHIAVECSDLDISVAFYGSTFGFEEYFRHDIPTGMTIAYLRLGDTVLELLERKAEAMGGFHFCLKAEDFDAAMAMLAAKGIAVHTAPHPTAARVAREEGWRRAVFLGPDGEQIEIRG